ncbi:MAG: hypothetical protein WB902_27150 [Acetobacteraceae bacterium]
MTIVDRHEIELDTAAVRRALELSPRAAQAFGLPPLVPAGVRCNSRDGCIEVVYGTLTATRVFGLRAEALGALLISYCNRAGMPLPRHADKGVRVEREHVVLVCTLRLDEPPQPETPEGQISHAPEAIQAWSWIASPS